MNDVDWIRGFMAGSLTVVFIILMVAIIATNMIRKSEKKDPADWWKSGDEPPHYS